MKNDEAKRQFEQVLENSADDRLGYKKTQILMMFYGIGYEKPMSLEEIGQHFDVTRERIRQLLGQGKRVVANIIQGLEEEQKRKERMEETRAKGIEGLTVEDLELSNRTYNCLLNAGITHVSQFAGISEMELLRTKNFGRKSLNELKEILVQIGIRLKSSASLGELGGTQQSDLNTIIAGIKKLPEDEAREVSLCLLNLMLPFAVNNQAATDLLRHFRDRLLGE